MRRSLLLRGLSTVSVLAVALTAASVRADDSDDEAENSRYPFKLSIDSPEKAKSKRKRRRDRSVQAPSGWSLDFNLEIRLREGQAIAGENTSEANPVPLLGQTGWIILEGADTEQPARIGDTYFNTFPPPPGQDPDPSVIELTEVVEFTIDEDSPDRLDTIGNREVRNSQAENTAITPPFGHGPEVPEPAESCTLDPRFNIDPLCEASGIGYGPNDDLPGFVLLSDIGVGINLTSPFVATRSPELVTDDILGPYIYLPPPSAEVPCSVESCEAPTSCPDGNCTGEFLTVVDNWVPTPTASARNLAGLMTYVSYEARNQSRRASISTGMVVPPALFVPSILLDPNQNAQLGGELVLGTNCGSGFEEGWTVRVDGGPVQCYDSEIGVDLVDRLWMNQFRSSFTVRAFLVEGVAPDIWEDCNGDGVADGDDAGHLGCPERLSNEVVMTINQIGPFPNTNYKLSTFCEGNGSGRNLTSVDFEGDDDQPIFPPVCPRGAGRGNFR